MKTKGFTLIELLLVIVIIVMSVSVVVSNIGTGNQTALLNGAVREIASALRFTRGHALTHSKESSFVFNLQENTYQVTGRDKVFKLSSDLDITLNIAQSQVSETTGGIRYFPDGSSTGGRITLELGENKRQLDINWLTGQVVIDEF